MIERDGLWKGGFGEANGPKCVMGALNFVRSGNVNLAQTPKDEWHYDPQAIDDGLVASIIKDQFPRRTIYTTAVVPAFNDHPETTAADVVMVLEKAAVRAEEFDTKEAA